VLSGEYVTDKIDTANAGALYKMLVYVMFDFTVSNTGEGWDIIAPMPNNWEALAKEGSVWKAWDEFLYYPKKAPAPSLDVEIDYSVSEVGPYSTVKRAELLYALVVGYRKHSDNNVKFN
jgi:hypothetical protein